MWFLYDSTRPTTAHILGDCPVALMQQRYVYCHDHGQVLSLLASKLKEIVIEKHLKPLFYLPYQSHLTGGQILLLYNSRFRTQHLI